MLCCRTLQAEAEALRAEAEAEQNPQAEVPYF